MKRYAAALLLGAVLVMGCGLTPEQQEKVTQLTELIVSFEDNYAALDVSIRDVVDQIKAGEIPEQEGLVLIETYKEQKAEIEGKLAEARRLRSDLEDSGANPWLVGGSILLDLAALFFGVKKWAAAVKAARIAKSMIYAIEDSDHSGVKQDVKAQSKADKIMGEVDAFVQEALKTREG